MPGLRQAILSTIALFLSSCGRQSPSGDFAGELRDWVHEVFQGKVVTGGHSCELLLILRQTPEGTFAEMNFRHPKMEAVRRVGKWEVGDGERVILFDDDKSPSEYYLIKRGVRFAFQTKDGLSNDDGSPVLMVRNEGLSRKASYPLKLSFEGNGVARVKGVGEEVLQGEWKWASEKLVVAVSMPTPPNPTQSLEASETYKYFLQWSDTHPSELLLEKMLILRPFLKKDGSKRQSWMSSLHFTDKPKLRRVGH